MNTRELAFLSVLFNLETEQIREQAANTNIAFLALMISQGEDPTVFKTDNLVTVGDEVVTTGTGSLVREGV